MSRESESASIETVPWDERTWKHLLASIEAQNVIPIIGPDLLLVDADGQKMLLDRYLAKQLAQEFKLSLETAAGEPTLNDVVCGLLARRESRGFVYSTICGILKEASLVPPEPLKKLAEISHFNLFVTTTFDPLLEDAINCVRFGGRRETRSVNYRHNKEDAKKDIESDQAELPTTVFYLMGKVAPMPDYVVTDEDLLEFACNIQLEARRPKKLFHELEENHLLILGQNFSDWFARIFLRTAKQRRLSDARDWFEFLADGRTFGDANLVFFLRHFSGQTRIYPFGDAIDFVTELWQRWCKRNPHAIPNPQEPEIPPPAEMPPGAIFISYASEDASAVKKLKAGLDAAGLIAWYDKEQLKGGQTFESEIKQYIGQKCSCFVPVLSKNTEIRDEGFFRKEWNWAVDRDEGIDRAKSFIVPVVVDGTDIRSIEHLDKFRRFGELHMIPLATGKVTPEFVERMKQIVRRHVANRR